MNDTRVNLTSRRIASRQDAKLEQFFNRMRFIDTLLVERNQGAAQQTRNIGGSVRSDIFATFGGGGGTSVGA